MILNFKFLLDGYKNSDYKRAFGIRLDRMSLIGSRIVRFGFEMISERVVKAKYVITGYKHDGKIPKQTGQVTHAHAEIIEWLCPVAHEIDIVWIIVWPSASEFI